MSYLAAEQRLVELLEPIADLRAVLTAADLERVQARAQLAPAAHVLYWGDQLQDTGERRTLSHINQQWLVILVVRTEADSASAGQLLSQIIATLQGAPVSQGPALTPPLFKRINAPARPWHADGFSYYPLAFSHKLLQAGA